MSEISRIATSSFASFVQGLDFEETHFRVAGENRFSAPPVGVSLASRMHVEEPVPPDLGNGHAPYVAQLRSAANLLAPYLGAHVDLLNRTVSTTDGQRYSVGQLLANGFVRQSQEDGQRILAAIGGTNSDVHAVHEVGKLKSIKELLPDLTSNDFILGAVFALGLRGFKVRSIGRISRGVDASVLDATGVVRLRNLGHKYSDLIAKARKGQSHQLKNKLETLRLQHDSLDQVIAGLEKKLVFADFGSKESSELSRQLNNKRNEKGNVVNEIKYLQSVLDDIFKY